MHQLPPAGPMAAAARRRGSDAPAVTVVVCTRDRPQELDECLAALAAQSYRDFSVLVVDNGPERPAAAVCSRRGAAYLYDPVPGLSRARNTGARASEGDIVAFTDDDALPEPGWLAALVAEFADPAVMAAAGHIRYLTGTAAGRMRGPEPDPAPAAPRPRRIFDHATPDWFAQACFGGIGDGGNMAFRRRVFEHWEGFDERLGRGRPIDGGEEHLAFRWLIDHGYKVAYTPAAIVRHPCPDTEGQRRARRLGALRSSAAYICLLFAEFPRHRGALLRYLAGAAWRVRPIGPGRGRAVRLLFSASSARALASGLWLYCRLARGRRRAAGDGMRAEGAARASPVYRIPRLWTK